jgi:hypothetical protein
MQLLNDGDAHPREKDAMNLGSCGYHMGHISSTIALSPRILSDFAYCSIHCAGAVLKDLVDAQFLLINCDEPPATTNMKVRKRDFTAARRTSKTCTFATSCIVNYFANVSYSATRV